MRQNSNTFPPLSRVCSVVLLAAGRGTRMQSTEPKVLHPLSGKPLIFYVVQAVHQALPQAEIAVVVGFAREKVTHYLRHEPLFAGISFVWITQTEQKGTGDALAAVMSSPWGEAQLAGKSCFLVLPGDQPFMTKKLILSFIGLQAVGANSCAQGLSSETSSVQPSRAITAGADTSAEKELSLPSILGEREGMRLLTRTVADPSGFGRVLRAAGDSGGDIMAVVEEKEATPKQRQLREVATSVYLFQGELLQQGLKTLSPENQQGEYYLTDLVGFTYAQGLQVGGVLWGESEDLMGVNDGWELALASEAMNRRILKKWAKAGVIFPAGVAAVTVDIAVRLARGVRVHQGVRLTGATEIGEDTVLESGVVLHEVKVGARVKILTGTVARQSLIGDEAQVGPYAHLREGSKLGEGTRIGNFVELKQTQVGARSKIAHLSYLGDAVVGESVTIGCGFVTCNFDGRTRAGKRKHATIIEDQVFLGSACQSVAPLRIGRGAYVASGSTLTEDVPAGGLAIARSRQINKRDYAKRYRDLDQGEMAASALGVTADQKTKGAPCAE